MKPHRPAAWTFAAILLAAAAPRLYAETIVSGAIDSGEWTAAGSPYHATADLTIAIGNTLVIGPGVTVAFDPDISLVVRGALEVHGTADGKVRFIRAQPATAWGGVALIGAGATGLFQHLEMTQATVAKTGTTDFPAAFKILTGAKVRVEDSWFHDFPNPAIDSGGQSELVILDSLVEVCKEAIHSASSFAHIERCTLRNITGYSDFIDFDLDSTPHSIVRDCILENNIEDDGIDTGETDCLIENVVIRGCRAGKALSLEGKSTPVLRNITISDCKWGLVSKDSCTPEVHHATITRCEFGISCYQKNAGRGGGHGSGDSFIVWDNATQVQLDALSSFDLTFSDVQGGYAGEGNIAADPLFVDAPANDFHLQPGSPAIGTGKDDGKDESDMGAWPSIAPPDPVFLRGDANGDAIVDLSDAVVILFQSFAVMDPPACPDALDADDNGDINITDAIRILQYLFLDGSPPESPYPAPGPDPTAGDPLSCRT